MRKPIALLIAAALLATGCTPSSPASVDPTPPVAAPVQSVDELNDRAFTLIKEERWNEAIATAQQAIALDSQSSAAHFNLGRALLGAGRAAEAAVAFDTASALTGGENADVEFFRGQAKVASQQEGEAIQLWAEALEGPLAGDREIAAALQELLKTQSASLAVGDVDADGKPDLLRITEYRFRITSGTGRPLYDGEIMENWPKENPYHIALYPLKDGAPLIHIAIPACPYAPQNAFFWYDGKQVVTVENEGPCSLFSGGSELNQFEQGMRAGGIYLISIMRFEQGRFETVGGKSRLMWPPQQEQIGYLLESITALPLEEPGELFADLKVHEEFRSRTAEGRWEFQEGGESGPDFVQVKPVQNGKTLGIARVSLQKDAEGNLRIAAIDWP